MCCKSYSADDISWCFSENTIVLAKGTFFTWPESHCNWTRLRMSYSCIFMHSSLCWFSCLPSLHVKILAILKKLGQMPKDAIPNLFTRFNYTFFELWLALCINLTFPSSRANLISTTITNSPSLTLCHTSTSFTGYLVSFFKDKRQVCFTLPDTLPSTQLWLRKHWKIKAHQLQRTNSMEFLHLPSNCSIMTVQTFW